MLGASAPPGKPQTYLMWSNMCLDKEGSHSSCFLPFPLLSGFRLIEHVPGSTYLEHSMVYAWGTQR